MFLCKSLSPDRRQTITNAELLSIECLETTFGDISIKIHIFVEKNAVDNLRWHFNQNTHFRSRKCSSKCHMQNVDHADNALTHWGRVTHICVGKLTIIGSDNGLSPDRRQAIIWTNAGILLIEPLGTNFSEILIEIHIFSSKKMHLKMSSGKWRPFCLSLNVLNVLPA